tara:strand:+ start:38 stop:397 length:360 start_codon:yes stop_codon:yes gene_type:complete
MKTVLPDTNIILWTFSGGPDFREAIKEAIPGSNISIPKCIISELKKMNSNNAKAALQICNTLPTEDIGDGYADNMLIDAAKKGFTIATNDKEILKKLKVLKINALKIREKTKLVSTEGI